MPIDFVSRISIPPPHPPHLLLLSVYFPASVKTKKHGRIATVSLSPAPEVTASNALFCFDGSVWSLFLLSSLSPGGDHDTHPLSLRPLQVFQPFSRSSDKVKALLLLFFSPWLCFYYRFRFSLLSFS